jgi:hypothetical protein
MKHVAAATSVVALLLLSGVVAAQTAEPSRAECVEAHRSAQELKQSSKLLEAQELLAVCSAGSCPGAIITDCGNWISELEQLTPSIVFEVRRDGKEALDATVLVDGHAVGDRAHALKVNPGRHTVRVELPPFEPHEEDLVLPEGQRMRLISVAFDTKKPEPAASLPLAPPPKQTVRPTPVAVYPLLGVGILGLGGFGAFALLGKQEQSKLERDCSPRCSEQDLQAMKRWYLIGDISAGAGAAALLGAGIVYLARPSREIERDSASLHFGLGPVRGAQVSSFGINAARRW